MRKVIRQKLDVSYARVDWSSFSPVFCSIEVRDVTKSWCNTPKNWEWVSEWKKQARRERLRERLLLGSRCVDEAFLELFVHPSVVVVQNLSGMPPRKMLCECVCVYVCIIRRMMAVLFRRNWFYLVPTYVHSERKVCKWICGHPYSLL